MDYQVIDQVAASDVETTDIVEVVDPDGLLYRGEVTHISDLDDDVILHVIDETDFYELHLVHLDPFHKVNILGIDYEGIEV